MLFSPKIAISIYTPDARNLIYPCEDAWSYVQIHCKTCNAGVDHEWVLGMQVFASACPDTGFILEYQNFSLFFNNIF